MPIKLLAAAVALSASLIATAASAAPVVWTIPSTPVTGGRIISGNFVFDASLPADQRLVSINVTETGPTPTTYAFTGGLNDPFVFGQSVAVATTSDRAIAINLSAIPTSAGGNHTVPVIYVERCITVTAGKCTNLGVTLSAHNVVISSSAPAAVPTLSEWAMILFGMILAGGAGLYIQRRRQIV